jgi:hypothetical protein
LSPSARPVLGAGLCFLGPEDHKIRFLQANPINEPPALRALFLLLLLANILFLAWARWVALPPAPAGRPTAASAGAGSIRLVSEAPPAAELSSAVPATGLSDATAGALACVSGGPYLDQATASEAAGRLERLGFISRQRASRDDVTVGQWVRVENLATAEDAANALAALQAAGITNAEVLADEPPGNVVSLGVFADPAKAAEAAAAAQKAGFTTLTEDRFRPADVFWLDVDRQSNEGLPGLEVFQGEDAQPPRIELRPCPVATQAATSVGGMP